MPLPSYHDDPPGTVKFLLGPAGSGKTWRCLTEIRSRLRQSPEGPMLVLLAPKQATFQLERQLLSDGSLAGYTRLQILSFERLGEWVLDRLGLGPRECLDEEGRWMVLRALLAQRQPELRLFRAAARLPGFAQQLSWTLRELQRGRLGQACLATLQRKPSLRPALRDKLHDLTLLLEAYERWLKDHELDDAHRQLDHAVDAALGANAIASDPSDPNPVPLASRLELGGLWLDGFVELTSQEIELLTALAPCCRRLTLALCLDTDPGGEASWHSPWSVISQTYRRLRTRLESLAECRIEVELLPRGGRDGRFAGNPILAHLESQWEHAHPLEVLTGGRECPLRLVTCANPEEEAVFAAREIRRYVRERRGRFRDVAVLLRTLDGYHDTLRRVFQRYDLPFFLDRREAVAHHPLAELTRYALRTVTFGWQPDDWFGALKSGLVPATEEEIDELENTARAEGWRGETWHDSLELPGRPGCAQRLDQLRRRLVVPFEALARDLAAPGGEPTGQEVVGALDALWRELGVGKRLADWPSSLPRAGDDRPSAGSPHATVWDRMQSWLANLERGFRSTSLPLREWLPIVEAGLAGLTVGVVPPALDQVLIGTVDRSRHPDLKLALVLGLNESVFPAPPRLTSLLTETEQADLETAGVFLGPGTRRRLGHEGYLAYIAFTRAADRLVITAARRDSAGRSLNLSPLLAHLQRMFPGLAAESGASDLEAASAEHPIELLPELIRSCRAVPPDQFPAPLRSLPAVEHTRAWVERLDAAQAQTRLDPVLATALYGGVLHTSVSALEDFAACPFRFFILRGLRAEERRGFELDSRERGSFQHAILQEFHRELTLQGQTWRVLSPEEAEAKVRRIGERMLPTFRNGLLARSGIARMNAELLIESLRRLIAVLVGWMDRYEFDPKMVEVDFGRHKDGLPGWELDLGEGRRLVLSGRIDRVDLCAGDQPGQTLVVVVDYKSSEHKLSATRLHHGLQLQLLAYLNALVQVGRSRAEFGGSEPVAAGAFYVNLRGRIASAASRGESEAQAESHRRSGYQHTGRFLAEALGRFDNRGVERGAQFRYRRRKDGRLAERESDGLSGTAFAELLRQNRDSLQEHGRAILAGEARVAPYRLGSECACQFCACQAVCRFDPWIHNYRTLTSPPRPACTEAPGGLRDERTPL